jgi:predicted acyl esterase
MIPWEGMSDYYRDRCRQGGILSNGFIKFWWDRQVITNQYGRPGRSARNWGPDTIEGDLSEEELVANRNDQTEDNATNKFRDDPYYASKEYSMSDIQVPLLSVANWGGICLHLRGNVQGWLWAGSEFKYLRFITGRHDLPFYYHEEVEIQRSFLDAFLKGEDREGWSVKGKVAPVSVLLRKGNVGFNDAEAEKVYTRREETEWPISRTQYTKFFLDAAGSLSTSEPLVKRSEKLSYKALGTIEQPELLRFETKPFEAETELTGHVVAHLNVSVTPYSGSESIPTDIDLFVTLRYFGPDGKEVFYTGTAGDPVPLTKGWQRVSLRKVDSTHYKNKSWLPHRNYTSADVEPVIIGEVYPIDVEIWPTNVVVEKGGKIVLEVASGDTQGAGIFLHNDPVDRYVLHLLRILQDFTLLTGFSTFQIKREIRRIESYSLWSSLLELSYATYHTLVMSACDCYQSIVVYASISAFISNINGRSRNSNCALTVYITSMPSYHGFPSI